jgi:hypothetical protein
MMTFEDFTAFPRGCEVLLAGRVEECPVCGRNGIESRDADRECFVHAQQTDVIGDGMRVEPVDLCLVGPAS